ncbi:ankyrin repeat-containing domain protein [Cladorrhinum sp. PSN332]|nr:ankyrin repeat-containing domain protein [Cladorrhinum sp. PSN332]
MRRYRLPRPPRRPKQNLQTLAAAGNLDQFEQYLAESGSNINITDNTGMAAIHTASFRSQSSVVERLLSKQDLDINCLGKDGKTALHLAAMSGSEQVVQKLCESGIDITIKDKYSRTALHDAIDSPDSERLNVVKALLKASDIATIINDVDSQGRTALAWAGQLGYKEIVKELITHGADCSTCDLDGNTILHTTLEMDPKMAEFVVRTWFGNKDQDNEPRLMYRYNLATMKNWEGQTPLHVAARLDSSEWASVVCEAAMHGLVKWDLEGELTTLINIASTREDAIFCNAAFALTRNNVSPINPDRGRSGEGSILWAAVKMGNGAFLGKLLASALQQWKQSDAGRLYLQEVVSAIMRIENTEQGLSPFDLLLREKQWGALQGLFDPRLLDHEFQVPFGSLPVSDQSVIGEFKDLVHRTITDMIDNNPPLPAFSNQLAWLVVGEFKDLLHKMIAQSPDPRVTRDKALLQAALWGCSKRMMEHMMTHEGAMPNVSGLDPSDEDIIWTPLAMAAVQGHLGIVKQLLKQDGINPNLLTKILGFSMYCTRFTPLAMAVLSGHLDVVKHFVQVTVDRLVTVDLNAGAFTEYETYYETPLQLAIRQGHWKIANCLVHDALVRGGLIDLTVRSDARETVLEEALKRSETAQQKDKPDLHEFIERLKESHRFTGNGALR